jgi:hypothetical protein
MEDNRQVCFMCGANVNDYNNQNMNYNTGSFQMNNGNMGGYPQNNMSGYQQGNYQMNNTGAFQMTNNYGNTGANSGYGASDNSNYFGNVNRDTNAFSSGNNYNNFSSPKIQQQQPNQSSGHDTFKHLNDYDKIYDKVKNSDRDIFDFFADNKKLIRIVGIVLLVGLLALIGWRYSVHRTKEKPVKPVLASLYFKADPTLNKIEGGNNAGMVFTKDGTTGSACSIKIYAAPSTSENYVHDYFKAIKVSLEPEKNTTLKPVNEMEVFTAQDGSFTINKVEWFYLNIFYKEKSTDPNPTLLKRRYYSTIYKGNYYNAELTNNQGDDGCEAALDNTIMTFKLIDS